MLGFVNCKTWFFHDDIYELRKNLDFDEFDGIDEIYDFLVDLSLDMDVFDKDIDFSDLSIKYFFNDENIRND